MTQVGTVAEDRFVGSLEVKKLVVKGVRRNLRSEQSLP